MVVWIAKGILQVYPHTHFIFPPWGARYLVNILKSTQDVDVAILTQLDDF